MSGPQFTPGPWEPRSRPAFGDDETAVEPTNPNANDGRVIALCCGPSRDANANLIAAAPDLLLAAETVLAGLNARIDAADPSSVPVFAGIAALSDAINKARGEPA